MKSTLLKGHLLTLPLILGALPASYVAAEDNAKEEYKNTWGLGLGVRAREATYAGDDSETIALPIIFFDSRWVRLAGPDLDLKLGSVNDIEFSVRAKFALGDGYEADDADILRGMEEREASIWVGPSVTWENDIVDISLEALSDAMGNSEGQQALIKLSKNFRIGQRFIIEPSIGATWFSEKYVDYYYGVEAAEARIDRPEYEGDATVVSNVNIRLTYGFDAHQSISLSAGVNSFDREIEYSPLIDKDTEGRVSLAYLYRF